MCHRYTGGHSEEDHSQAFPSTSGGQAAQFGFGVRETRALQEEESRFSWEERREGDGEIPLKLPRSSLLGGVFKLARRTGEFVWLIKSPCEVWEEGNTRQFTAKLLHHCLTGFLSGKASKLTTLS